MHKHLLILMVCVLMQGCASTLSLNPQILDGQQKIQQDDITTVVSSKSMLVAIRPSTPYSSTRRPEFVVAILNASNASFDVSTDNIQVYVDTVAHKVFTLEELVAEAVRKQEQAEADAALDDLRYAMRLFARRGYWGLGDPYAYGGYGFGRYGFFGHYGFRGNSFGRYGYGVRRCGYSYGAYGYESCLGYGRNVVIVPQMQPVVKASVADVQAQENKQALIGEADQLLTVFGSTLLQKTTIPPQAWYGGYITIAPIPNPDLLHEIKIVITVAGEKHEFMLQQVMVEK